MRARHQHVTSIRVAKSFDMSVPVGSLKKASVSVDLFSAITSSASGRTTGACRPSKSPISDQVLVGRKIDRGVEGRIIDAEGQLALERHRLGRLDGEEHQKLAVLVVDIDHVGLGDARSVLPSIGQRRVVVELLRARSRTVLPISSSSGGSSTRLVFLSKSISTLEEKTSSKRQTLCSSGDVAVAAGDDFQPRIGEDMRMGHGRDRASATSMAVEWQDLLQHVVDDP